VSCRLKLNAATAVRKTSGLWCSRDVPLEETLVPFRRELIASILPHDHPRRLLVRVGFSATLNDCHHLILPSGVNPEACNLVRFSSPVCGPPKGGLRRRGERSRRHGCRSSAFQKNLEAISPSPARRLRDGMRNVCPALNPPSTEPPMSVRNTSRAMNRLRRGSITGFESLPPSGSWLCLGLCIPSQLHACDVVRGCTGLVGRHS
jgi:hypothetical protein